MLTEKVREYAEKYHMFQKNDRIVVGVSGGADSLCLLHILVNLKEEYDMELTAVHIHHKIRGAEADEDMEHTVRVCRGLGVDCQTFWRSVPDIAKERGMTLEEAGRAVRYEIFHRVLEETGADKIAVAHNLRDNCETILFHMCRGTGLRGIRGIPPVRGKIIRPLLNTDRSEIEEYLLQGGIKYRVDSTNLKSDYIRNGIRNVILPYMEEHVNRQSVRHIVSAGERAADVCDYVEQQAEKVWEACVRENAGQVFISEKILSQHPAVADLAVEKAIEQMAGKRKDIGAIHIKGVKSLFEKQVSSSVALPYGLSAVRTYEGVSIRRKVNRAPAQNRVCIPVEQNGSYRFENGTISFKTVKGKENFKEIPEKLYTKWFDCDKIKDTLLIRNRQPGDYLIVDAAGGRKKLKEYLINEKVPKEKRDNLLLLADGQHIVWIIGYRMSEEYKISESTERALEVNVAWQQEE